ncbi:MAG: hypothetical protein Q9198_003259 [Flavoplaca austrocitrina]
MELTANLSYNDKVDVRPGEDAPNTSIKLFNLSRSKFLQLPAEIRLRIYSFSLNSPSPIIVWSAESHHGNYKPTHKRTWHREKMASSRRNLALGLLRCSTIVAAESAQFFYSRNTFRFQGDHEYYPVITWLDKLNDNREYLGSLEITVRRPSKAPKFYAPPRKAYSTYSGFTPVSPHIVPFMLPDGDIDIIDPVIETIISRLVKPRRNQTMTLCFDAGSFYLPGVDLWMSENVVLLNMDFPNSVEMWRTKHCLDDNQASLDVVWRVAVNKEDFHTPGCSREMIEGIGWKILDEQQAELIHDPWDRSEDGTASSSIQLLMRRDSFHVATATGFMLSDKSLT